MWFVGVLRHVRRYEPQGAGQAALGRRVGGPCNQGVPQGLPAPGLPEVFCAVHPRAHVQDLLAGALAIASLSSDDQSQSVGRLVVRSFLGLLIGLFTCDVSYVLVCEYHVWCFHARVFCFMFGCVGLVADVQCLISDVR